MEISEALLRIASSISSVKRDEWKKSIESFFHEPLTPDAQENVLQLRLWYRKEMETKDKVEELTEVVKQIKINQDQILMLMNIHVLAEKVVEGSESSVRPLPFAAPRAQGVHLPSKNDETRILISPEHPSVEDTPSTSAELRGIVKKFLTSGLLFVHSENHLINCLNI